MTAVSTRAHGRGGTVVVRARLTVVLALGLLAASGISYLALELVGKRIELIKEVLPGAKRVAESALAAIEKSAARL